MIKASNSYAIPVLTCSFRIIECAISELKTIQLIIGTLITKFRKHRLKSCLQRLTLLRKDCGRALIDITNLNKRQIKNLKEYFRKKSESPILHTDV